MIDSPNFWRYGCSQNLGNRSVNSLSIYDGRGQQSYFNEIHMILVFYESFIYKDSLTHITCKMHIVPKSVFVPLFTRFREIPPTLKDDEIDILSCRQQKYHFRYFSNTGRTISDKSHIFFHEVESTYHTLL